MVLYNKFGFELKILEKKDGRDIFRLLSKAKLGERTGMMRTKDRDVLKGEIRFALTKENYNPIGVFKDNKLIGVSFSSMVEGENVPWLGYMFIHKDHRNGKAIIVIMNYLINHLYDGMKIQIGPGDKSLYQKVVKPISKVFHFELFKDDFGPRLKKICKEDK